MRQKNAHKIIALIAAAGNGSRAKTDIPKQYVVINGKTILRHTIDKLQSVPAIQAIKVIIDPAYAEQARQSVTSLKNIDFINGADSRKDSIFNGLSSLSHVNNEDIILIHDAARPFIDTKDIEALLCALQTHNGATLSCPVSESICVLRHDDEIESYQNRDAHRLIQTPQVFRYGALMDAHSKFRDDDSFTDDASLLLAMGERIALVEGGRQNIKITTPEDLKMAQSILYQPSIIRTGQGFDVHAFDGEPAETIRLGGLDIPYHKKLKGHSDADVVLHAVTDALLGAMGKGDIGEHFPPCDPQWAGKDSAHFLEHAAKLAAEVQADITHIDITIICEAPKLGAYKAPMAHRIGDIVGLAHTLVNIKATTTEKLGFTGRGEGIACQAITTIACPA